MLSKVICTSGIDLHKGEYPHQQNLLDFQSVMKCVRRECLEFYNQVLVAVTPKKTSTRKL